MPDPQDVQVFPDLPALASAAAALCIDSARRAIADRGAFHVALSGGSTPRPLHECLAARSSTDWTRWHVWFGDERCVPQDHPDSNYRMARETLLDRVPIPASQIHPMYEGGAPEAAATAYANLLGSQLPATGGFPALDLVLLGMGDDGHTASLFPGCAALGEEHATTATCTAPNGSTRITLTPPAILAAREVVVLVSGTAKAAVFAQIRAGLGDDLPIARLARQGRFVWLADRAAAEGA